MLADPRKASDVFHATLHEAAIQAASDEPPRDRLWFFRDARWRCLEVSEKGLQAEDLDLQQSEISPSAPGQIEKLEPEQLAIWISAAPEPQRSALAFFYLDEFDHQELLSLTELKSTELGKLLAEGRQQFQAWLNTIMPAAE